MEVPEKADAHTLAAWHALADQVADALRSAGLPVTGPATAVIAAGAGRKHGAFVEVDPFADSAGGVFVFWQVPDYLLHPTHEAVLAGRLDDPAIRHHGQVVSIMIDAMKRLLAESNFAVEDAATVADLRPLQIHLKSGDLESPTSSLSGLLNDPRDVQEPRSQAPKGCPRVTMRLPERPLDRARGGHGTGPCYRHRVRVSRSGSDSIFAAVTWG